MDDYCDPDKTDEVMWNQTTALSNAKTYWTNKFGSQMNGTHIVLAPHTLRLMNCCSIAVDRYCVVIGKCEDKVPSTSADHTILDLPEHPEFTSNLEILREFIQELRLTKIYTFHIEQPLGSHKQFAHATVLAAVWKFFCKYEPDLDNDDLFISSLLKIVNKRKIPISISEMRAVIDGSLENGYFSYFVNDMYVANGSNESPLETENVKAFFTNYDFVYLKTNMSNIHYTRDIYAKKTLMNTLRNGFKQAADIDPYEDSCYDNPFFVGSSLSSYSRSRLRRREFPGNEYEHHYQSIVDKLSDRADKWIKGGEVQPGGILLVTEIDAFHNHQFLVTLAQAFLDINAPFGFISLELLRAASGAHCVGLDDFNQKIGTMKSVRPTEAFVAGLHNYNPIADRLVACDTPQHYLLDDSRSGSDDDTYIEDSEILI